MREVGTLAGVSLKTVSRVINRDPTVSPIIVDRVLRAVELLDYRPNRAATALRRIDRKTATVGLLLEDAANPFSSTIHRAVEGAMREHGILLFTGSSDEDPEREEEVLAAFLSHQVDGLIVVSSDPRRVSLGRQRDWSVPVPMVFLDRPAASADADSATVDNRSAAAGAVRHMARQGHDRIAFLGDLRSIWTASERDQGYRDGLALAGLAFDDRIAARDVRTDKDAERRVLDMFALDEPPTALFTGRNLITIGAVRALRTLGLQHRIALVGFDDIPLAEMLDPPLTVVEQNAALLGETAARLLLGRLDGDSKPYEHVVVPTRLVMRGSGEIPPGGVM